MSDWLSFKGDVSDIDEPLLSDQLETNLFAWLNHCLLNIGSFTDVNIPTSGAYGGAAHALKPLRDANYNDGQVWQAFRKDWVWESGTYASRSPIRVSGVFVNGVFRPSSGVGPYAHKVNYPLGQIVFDTAIATTATVTCEYSFRRWQITTADSPWWRDIQFGSYRADDSHFSQMGSGQWSAPGQSRVQLPAIVIEAVPRTERYGHSVGSQTAVVSQDVLLHVLAESRWDMKQMHDILTYQWEKNIRTFDKQALFAASGAPLDADGSPRSGTSIYPDWVKPEEEGGYGWKTVRFREVSSSGGEGENPPLYNCTVRFTCEVRLP